MTPQPKPDSDFPWWLVILLITGAVLFYQVLADAVYTAALGTLIKGLGVTVGVALVAYLGASLLGLGLAVMGLSRHRILRQTARLYIEVMRGIPILVLLLYVAFVLSPALVWAVNKALTPLGFAEWRARDFPLIARAVIALMLAYSSFLAEIFRAGLQAVDKGQIEAAQALGLNGWPRVCHIGFPQAVRMILPPFGNHAAGQGDGGGQLSLFRDL